MKKQQQKQQQSVTTADSSTSAKTAPITAAPIVAETVSKSSLKKYVIPPSSGASSIDADVSPPSTEESSLRKSGRQRKHRAIYDGEVEVHISSVGTPTVGRATANRQFGSASLLADAATKDHRGKIQVDAKGVASGLPPNNENSSQPPQRKRGRTLSSTVSTADVDNKRCGIGIRATTKSPSIEGAGLVATKQVQGFVGKGDVPEDGRVGEEDSEADDGDGGSEINEDGVEQAESTADADASSDHEDDDVSDMQNAVTEDLWCEVCLDNPEITSCKYCGCKVHRSVCFCLSMLNLVFYR